jgi:hypothetical protein
MKILKTAIDSQLFLIQNLTTEEIIALNDIASNYRQYVEKLLEMEDKELNSFAPGEAKKVRVSLRLQRNTCRRYENAFSEIINKSNTQNPKFN